MLHSTKTTVSWVSQRAGCWAAGRVWVQTPAISLLSPLVCHQTLIIRQQTWHLLTCYFNPWLTNTRRTASKVLAAHLFPWQRGPIDLSYWLRMKISVDLLKKTPTHTHTQYKSHTHQLSISRDDETAECLSNQVNSPSRAVEKAAQRRDMKEDLWRASGRFALI